MDGKWLEGTDLKNLTNDEIIEIIGSINGSLRWKKKQQIELELVKLQYLNILKERDMENEVKPPFMMSLYDYLGRAAGGELGAVVYTTAKALKETINTSKVSNPKYEGNIMMYRREFLDEYFGNKIYEGEKK